MTTKVKKKKKKRERERQQENDTPLALEKDKRTLQTESICFVDLVFPFPSPSPSLCRRPSPTIVDPSMNCPTMNYSTMIANLRDPIASKKSIRAESLDRRSISYLLVGGFEQFQALTLKFIGCFFNILNRFIIFVVQLLA